MLPVFSVGGQKEQLIQWPYRLTWNLDGMKSEILERTMALSVTAMLRNLLVEKKSAIVDKWVRRFLGYYPSESLKFLTSQKDRFANPVGYTISSSAGAIFDELVGDGDLQVTEVLLKDVVRIRAVQDFSPSQAIRFVFDLKEVIRGEMEKETREIACRDELMELESRIDNLALIAFDSYVESREKLFRIRLDEVKARSLQAMAEDGGVRHDGNGKHDGF